MVNGGWPDGMLPLLPMQQGVCSVCHQYNRKGWGECQTCSKVMAQLNLIPIFRSGLVRSLDNGLPQIISVLPLSLRLKSERDETTDAYRYFYQYKGNADKPNGQAKVFIQQLCEVAVLHERCLATRLMLTDKQFDHVLTLPSKSGRLGVHPLNEVASNSAFGRRLLEGLTYVGPVQQTKMKRSNSASDWHVDEGLLHARSVLLLDDLWTKGGTALSAATALVQAGVKRVGVMTLGRHLDDPEGNYTSPGFQQLTVGLGWSSSYCVFCDDRVSAIANPPLPKQ